MLAPTAHKPDILEVIADLSNDEVRTPPWVTNAILDLLPVHVWSDSTLRWLDPGAKTGVFLREITKRLMIGLEEEIPDEKRRLEHILKNQVFGIAITELTALMSRRTVYCSKRADSEFSTVRFSRPWGNLWFRHVDHAYLKGRCEECSASEDTMEAGPNNHAYAFVHSDGRAKLEKDFEMNFDVIVGNPPYHLNADAAGKNVVPIYQDFVHQAIDLNPRYISMVIPSRWMVGGRGLDEFRNTMLKRGNVRTLVDYPNSAELFPGVDLKSGVCYFLWDRDDKGQCSITTYREKNVVGPETRPLDEYDVLVRDNRALPILKKVLSLEGPPLSELVSVRDPFGPNLGSNFRGYRSNRRSGDVRIYMNQDTTKTPVWTSRSNATRNLDLIDAWKVFVPKAGPGNSGGHVVPDVVLSRSTPAGPRSVCTATYLAVGPLASQKEASNLSAYIHTRFVRFLVSLRKPSQNTTRESYAWVPQQSWDREWTDEELYAKYGITDEEQAYIAEMVKEMPE